MAAVAQWRDGPDQAGLHFPFQFTKDETAEPSRLLETFFRALGGLHHAETDVPFWFFPGPLPSAVRRTATATTVTTDEAYIHPPECPSQRLPAPVYPLETIIYSDLKPPSQCLHAPPVPFP